MYISHDLQTAGFFLLNQIVIPKCVVVTAQQARIVYGYSEYLETLCLAVLKC